MDSFEEIIGLWPSAEALATDLGELGVTVRAWRNRNSIPPGHWMGVVAAAQRRQLQVTYEKLAEVAARKGKARAA